MMMTCRDLCCDKQAALKKYFTMNLFGLYRIIMKNLPIFFLILFFLYGCKNDKLISFCEGTDTAGKGVQCGLKFTTGDVTALVDTSNNFDTDKLQIKVYEQKKQKYELTESLSADVKPDSRKATVNLAFYNEGIYKVSIIGKEGKVISEGSIEIIDTY